MRSHAHQCEGPPNMPDRSRTCNLRLRRPTLYPIELRELEIHKRYSNSSDPDCPSFVSFTFKEVRLRRSRGSGRTPLFRPLAFVGMMAEPRTDGSDCP